MCQHLYDIIRSFKKEDGSLLCDSFIRAPKRRQEPQYYEIVSQPIDLLRVSIMNLVLKGHINNKSISYIILCKTNIIFWTWLFSPKKYFLILLFKIFIEFN